MLGDILLGAVFGGLIDGANGDDSIMDGVLTGGIIGGVANVLLCDEDEDEYSI